MSEILVFPAPEVVPRHHDFAAEAVLMNVGCCKRGALIRGKDRGDDRIAVGVEARGDFLPVERGHAPRDGGGGLRAGSGAERGGHDGRFSAWRGRPAMISRIL